jgi:hypothetical protein
MAFGRKFKSQREAVEYYGHTWSWILRHKKVVGCLGWVGGQQRNTGYYIENK